jgi:hypothetical protein
MMAMCYAFLGLLLTPLDWILQVYEKNLYCTAGKSELPQIFICGAPRSGTTLVAQVLMKHLPVYYFNNLTSIFPKSPITAQKLFGFLGKNDRQKIRFTSFYGRTPKISQPNDALYLWDRWTGNNRKQIPESLNEHSKKQMFQFFNAVALYAKQPLVNKNNSLNSFAHLVSEVLPNSFFICLDRNPLYLAQSHLIARRFINNDENQSYGVEFNHTSQPEDVIQEISEQVKNHKRMILKQQELIGTDRFIIINYEDFCDNPAKTVVKVAAKCLGLNLDMDYMNKVLPPFKISNKRKLSEHEFNKLALATK